jgi:hypothetical protein
MTASFEIIFLGEFFMRKAKFFVFIAALIVGIMFAQIFAFSFNFNLPNIRIFSKVKGSGNAQTERRDVSGFSSVRVSGAITVEVTAQKDFAVEVEADDNLLPNVKTEVRGDTLRIYTEGRFSTRSPIRVRIAMPQIESLDVSGASKGILTNVKNESLTLEANGASKITVDGETKELRADVNGASRLDAENLKTENVSVESNGASSAIVFANNEISARASGASSIRWTGDARSVESNSSGASSIKRK